MTFFIQKAYNPIYVFSMYKMTSHVRIDEITPEEAMETYEKMVTRALLTKDDEL